MKKEERLKQMREVAKKEELANMKKKVAEAGMGFTETDLPPDEVSERQVRRSVLTSLMSMVPYTQAYYESRAAEDEMDDLKKIRIEKVKAADLLSLAQMGRHEEALESMMAETNYDFFYFNKLKTKMIAEGKYNFDESQLINPFAGMEKGNRLRNAINENHSLLDGDMAAELNRLTVSPSGRVMGMDPNVCTWRGKGKNGVALKCTNPRIRTKKHKKGDPDALLYCFFHNPTCTSEVHIGANSGGDEIVPIKTPNAEGLCSQCHMMRMNRKAPHLSHETCPGVVVLTAENGGKSSKNNKKPPQTLASRPKRSKREGLCTWHPSAGNEAMRLWECNNLMFVDPVTEVRSQVCAWHLTQCVLTHPPGMSAVITKANEQGLCAMHFLAKTGSPLQETPFPFPGMKMKRAENFWKSAVGGGGHHWAAPRGEPLPNIMLHDYYPPRKPVEFYEQLRAAYQQRIYKKNFKKFSKSSSRLIQRAFRRYRVMNLHREKRFERNRRLRFKAAIAIQSRMRIFLRSKFMAGQRLRYNAAALVIQRYYRGFKCRQRLKIDWAARRIQKFMKKLHFLKFRDAVIMIMQLRLLAKKQHRLALVIQRVFRGYSTRVWVFNKRLWNFVCLMSARRIQRFYKREKARRALVPFRKPDESEILQRCATKLSRMILELYLDRRRRVELAALMNESAPEVQRLVRAFLARSGAKKMAFLRKAMRGWFHPQFAGEFMEKFLSRSIRTMNQEEHRGPERTGPVYGDHVRPFLPELYRRGFEVDRKVFDQALTEWYHFKCVPLVQTEKDSIRRKFKNPMSGHISITLLDRFISAHPLPCKKHGRTVCAECSVRKDCMLPNCKCKCYVRSSDKSTSICVSCNHPGTLHLLLPLQAVEAAHVGHDQEALLRALTADKQPDMSMPTEVTGVLADRMIIKPRHPDDIRMDIMGVDKKSKARTKLLASTAPWTIDKTISTGEIRGETIASSVEYWQQGLNSVVNLADLRAKEAASSEVFVFEPVAFDSHPPDYQHASDQFWSSTAKNPVKRVRDYHEKFDHNMPVPIVSNGELVYTFEGAQVYFNILNQIIAMDRRVGHDDPDFLRLVVDHVQIFERHWRKMVVDIRTGKLDRNVTVSHDSRMIFESTNLPRPLLATRLDATFRLLGFHKKVLGKDIVIQAYAPLRHPAKSADAFLNPRRKGSDPLLSLRRPTSRPDSTSATAAGAALGPVRGGSPQRPSSAGGALGGGGSPPRPLSRANSAEKPRTTSRGRRDTLLALGLQFRANTEAANAEKEASSRPGTRERRRRGSGSDAQRPASKHLVDQVHYELETAARDIYKHTLQVDGDHFVCPFPACGRSFRSKEAAFRHLPEHEQRTRLHAPTPLPDSHLSFYWPRGAPWQAANKYASRAIPPGSLACPHPGCLEVLQNQAKLDNHMRLVHGKVGDSSYAMGYFRFDGEGVCVPPNNPSPENIPLKWCPLHALPIGKCRVCVEIESHAGPKPPFKFYEAMSIDFKAKHSLLEMHSGTPQKPSDLRAHSRVVIHKDDWHLGVFVRLRLDLDGVSEGNSAAPKVECRARPLALLLDRNKDGWMAVELLYNYSEAHHRGLPMPADLHKRYELMQPILAEHLDLDEEAILRRFFRWVPMCDVIKPFHLHKMTKEQIDQALANPNVSKINTFYVRGIPM